MAELRRSFCLLRRFGHVKLFQCMRIRTGHCSLPTHARANNDRRVVQKSCIHRLAYNSRTYSTNHPSPQRRDKIEQIDLSQSDADEKRNIIENADEDDDDDSYYSAYLEYYVNKAQSDLDYMDDVEYHDIEDVNKRLFYKMIDVWLKEVGSTKRGHRDFIQALFNSMKRFNVEADIAAYLKLLDCFPEGKHTGIKRERWFKAAFQDKLPDHALGVKLLAHISIAKAVPNDKLFNKTTDLFGRFSPVTWTARSLLFWYPKVTAANPHPISETQFKELTPIEVAFNGLRQMNPSIDADYHNFSVDKSRCEQILDADKIDSVISVQTDKQKSLLAEHDVTVPIYIEGPNCSMYRSKKVHYYVMRCDPKEKRVDTAPQRTKILSTKEWWTEFYGKDWNTGTAIPSTIKEEFFPSVDVVDGYHDTKQKEISLVEKDTEMVEGQVYAIACTDYTDQEALLTWVRGLVKYNPIIKECSVILREESAFMLNAPKKDPNESLYDDIELPHVY